MFSSANNYIFNHLELLFNKLSAAEYTTSISELEGSTVGQHVRHVLEFYGCLLTGYEMGLFSYDKRARDLRLENDIDFARQTLRELELKMTDLPGNKVLAMEAELGMMTQQVNTTFDREVLYLAEHAVHHLAIIKTGLRCRFPEVSLPADFGVARSTQRYRETAVPVEAL